MTRLQIGIMGSAAVLAYSKQTAQRAAEIGTLIAEAGCTLVFGAERDCDSLSTVACRAAKAAGGLSVGVSYGAGRDGLCTEADVLVPTGIGRGGGREFVLVNCCDAIIAIGGGSGTLTEIAIAYQAGIPIVALTTEPGWAKRLAGEFLDDRRRLRVIAADTPTQAVRLAVEAAMEVMRNRLNRT